MARLDGKRVLITGGGSGLGRALVARFLEEGARVGILERDTAKVESLKQAYGDAIVAVTGSVSAIDDNRRAVQVTVEKFGALDCFIGNAGVFDYFQSINDLSDDQIGAAFDELFAVNVKGYLLGAKATVDELKKTGGSIIYTVSNAGFYPAGGGPIYTASKHAVVGLIRQLAYELAPTVRVNGVAPGGMRTELGGLAATGSAGQKLSDMPGLDEMVAGITPLRFAPTPEDYCGPYVLLACERDSRPITGVVINTDGGIGIRGFAPAGGPQSAT